MLFTLHNTVKSSTDGSEVPRLPRLRSDSASESDPGATRCISHHVCLGTSNCDSVGLSLMTLTVLRKVCAAPVTLLVNTCGRRDGVLVLRQKLRLRSAWRSALFLSWPRLAHLGEASCHAGKAYAEKK
ncbi:unnamed protein product [Rangifer tarandus platyrhynchus]|uniref:Uncharacterized protein n=1 Tax=Rangifer tarandus platyrhynchus TaxID=3082113 RepID=A0AC59YCG7_RANTA